MTPNHLRQSYPCFIYKTYSLQVIDNKNLSLKFDYEISGLSKFTHTTTFENLQFDPKDIGLLQDFAFHVGIAEITNYWKLTCSPQIIIECEELDKWQISWWHNLFIHGFGEYFYQNNIDFIQKDFLTFSCKATSNLPAGGPRKQSAVGSEDGIAVANKVLVPLGGGKDSIVTAEILKKHFPIRTTIVKPNTPASLEINSLLNALPPITITRIFDPKLNIFNKEGFLNGHIPYSAVLAFLFTFAALAEHILYIAVSNERSSDEGNIKYLGQDINHQYTKSSHFESDFNSYIKHITPNIKYFSFLRPLYELQITRIFAHMPEYFPLFKSCNKNQSLATWCGTCPKCISIALTMIPWVGESAVTKFMGTRPLTNPDNLEIIAAMTDPTKTKPFECVTTILEAQICQEFIAHGQTPHVQEFLSSWGDSPNMPKEFLSLLKSTYVNS